MEILKMAIYRNFLLLLIQISISKNHAFGRILRRACGDYADFNYIAYKQVLLGHIIKRVIVPSRAECEKRCVNEYTCKSVNVQMFGVERQCELNSRSFTDKSDGVSLTSKDGWMFSSTKYNERLVGHVCKKLDPCQPQHLCIDVCYQPGYKCHHCKELINGTTCQRTFHNIALRKPSRQSSVLEDSEELYQSDRAVDGLLDNVFAKCLHTKCIENIPWWSVDFQGKGVIFVLELVTREDHEDSLKRAANLHVQLGNVNNPNANPTIWVTVEAQTQRKEFTTPKTGQYLFIVSNTKKCLDFCEVVVNGYLE